MTRVNIEKPFKIIIIIYLFIIILLNIKLINK